MSQKLKDVHLFGEMDLNLTLNSSQIYKKSLLHWGAMRIFSGLG